MMACLLIALPLFLCMAGTLIALIFERGEDERFEGDKLIYRS